MEPINRKRLHTNDKHLRSFVKPLAWFAPGPVPVDGKQLSSASGVLRSEDIVSVQNQARATRHARIPRDRK